MGVSEVQIDNKINSYKDLRVWQLGIQIAKNIFEITEDFPSHHKYALAQQMQKCAISIPSNIAEGYARDGTGEYLYFISVALGSRAELETQLELAISINLIGRDKILQLIEDLEVLAKMLKKLSVRLKQISPNPKSNIQIPKEGT